MVSGLALIPSVIFKWFKFIFFHTRTKNSPYYFQSLSMLPSRVVQVTAAN